MIAITYTANGVAIADDATTPSNKAGRGFSHYFGLNDLVSSDRPAFYDNGLTAASPHGFTAGETLTFRFTGETGSRLVGLLPIVRDGADALLLGRWNRVTWLEEAPGDTPPFAVAYRPPTG